MRSGLSVQNLRFNVYHLGRIENFKLDLVAVYVCVPKIILRRFFPSYMDPHLLFE